MYAFKPHVFTEHSPNSIAKPEGRMKSKIRCDGKNLYIYNGKDPTVVDYRDLSDDLLFVATKPEFRDIWVYNLAGQQWRLMRNESNLPDNNDLIFGTIFESNYLVICTIRVPFNDELSSRKCRLHICDLITESVLVQGTSGQIPYPSFALNLIRHGKHFYTVGITRDLEEFSDVYKLNMENGVWEVVYSCRGLDSNEPIGRSGHTLVYGNSMIYIFGGAGDGPGLDAFSFVKISAFDLENCCWKVVETHGDENYIPHYPTEREDFGVTSYTDPDSGEINVVVSGGTVDHNDAFNDVWSLNLSSLKWTCLERFGTVLPCYVDSHSMTISPAGKLFTFGGYIFNNDMEQGTCSSSLNSTWLRIPNLTDICWEAVFHYYPDLKSMTDEEIISLGIPPQLLKSRIH
ncbi:kelch domain-containing protein 10 homolog [Microplitis demolitor]|uniref:kelch domain-containing protein 10 homolog n=1 Tax=Microplitis demolitor TaxID=69319 RepID=UPI0004CCD5FC|nr:kelch domain-containing protein 10 homolog [Microplitis demolitor]